MSLDIALEKKKKETIFLARKRNAKKINTKWTETINDHPAKKPLNCHGIKVVFHVARWEVVLLLGLMDYYVKGTGADTVQSSFGSWPNVFGVFGQA